MIEGTGACNVEEVVKGKEYKVALPSDSNSKVTKVNADGSGQ